MENKDVVVETSTKEKETKEAEAKKVDAKEKELQDKIALMEKEAKEKESKIALMEKEAKEKESKIAELNDKITTFVPTTNESKKEVNVYPYEKDCPLYVKQIVENAKTQSTDPDNTKGRNN